MNERMIRRGDQQRVLQRKTCACGKPISSESGECDDCRKKHEAAQSTVIQRSAANDTGIIPTPPSVDETLKASGQPLAGETRGLMESRFGHDFSGVRVHADSQAAQSARDVAAHAYTVGQDVVFGAGQYRPHTPDGQQLIAHELAHVVQQGQRRVSASDGNAGDDSHLEREAESAANALSGQVGVIPIRQETPVRLSRAPSGKYQTATPEILVVMDTMIAELAALRAGAPASKGAAQEAGRTFCVIKVVGADGTVKGTYTGAYMGRGLHAEQAAIAKMNIPAIQPTDSVLVAVDQFPCTDKCTPALKTLRGQVEGEFRVFHQVEVDPASREVTRSPKTVATNPKGATELMELNEFHRGRPGTPAPTPKTPVPAPKAAPPQPPEAAPGGQKAAPTPTPVPEAAAPGASKPGVTPPVPEAAAPGAPKAAPSVTPPPKNAPAEPGVNPKASGKWSGAGGGLLSVFAPYIAGWIHKKAVEKRVEEEANKKGYVSPEAPSGQGFLYDLGAWLLDPFRDAEKAVGLDKRLNIPVWRARIREKANSLKPGDIFKMTWDIGKCKFDFMGNQEVEHREVTYTKQPDGTWKITTGEPSGVPDINTIISADVSDERVRAMLERDPCAMTA